MTACAPLSCSPRMGVVEGEPSSSSGENVSVMGTSIRPSSLRALATNMFWTIPAFMSVTPGPVARSAARSSRKGRAPAVPAGKTVSICPIKATPGPHSTEWVRAEKTLPRPFIHCSSAGAGFFGSFAVWKPASASPPVTTPPTLFTSAASLVKESMLTMRSSMESISGSLSENHASSRSLH